jgi:hypothetical protein
LSAAFLNIAIGLATSVLSGGSVWAWQRARNSRVLRRKGTFFGLKPGGACLIVMNHKYNAPGSTAQDDVQVMIELATLASEIGSKVSVRSVDEVQGVNADRTEFCIGGPGSNPRTLGHLANHLPGVALRPYNTARRDSAAIVVGDQRFLYDHGKIEHALVAKFTPSVASRPVFIICGQRAIANRAAMHFLRHNYLALTRSLASVDQFCLVVKVISSDIYGHEMVELAGDVTTAAFTDQRTTARSLKGP